MPAFSKVTEYSLLAAVLYAIQHPFSKPLVGLNQVPAGTERLLLVSAAVALLAVMIVLACNRDLARTFVAIVLDIRRYRILLMTIVSGAVSMLVYIFYLGKFHPNVVTLFLNTSPIWAALVGAGLQRWSPDPNYKAPGAPFYCGSALIFCVLCFAVWYESQAPLGRFVGELSRALPMVIIPILVMMNFQLRQKFLPMQLGATAPVFINIVFAAIILAAYSAVVIQSTPGASFAPVVEADAILLYVLGTVGSTVAAHVVFQRAVNLSLGSGGGYVASYNFLISAFAVAIGLALSLLLARPELAPNLGHLIAIVLIVPILYALARKGVKARAGSTIGGRKIRARRTGIDQAAVTPAHTCARPPASAPCRPRQMCRLRRFGPKARPG